MVSVYQEAVSVRLNGYLWQKRLGRGDWEVKEKNGGDGRTEGEVRVCTYGPQTEKKRQGVMEYGTMTGRAF